MSQGDTLEAPKILARPKELPSRPPNPKLPPLDASGTLTL